MKPLIESVVTDMLNINLEVSKNREQNIIRRMNKRASKYGQRPFPKHGYKHVITLLYEIDDKHKDKRQLFCVSHYRNNRPSIHISLNPSELTKKQLKKIARSLRYLLGENVYPSLYTEGVVRRLDIACDIKNIIFEDLAFNRNRQRASGYYSVKPDGRIGAAYLGGKKSKLKFRIYDKNLKAKAKGLPQKEYPVLRIEAEISEGFTLHNIHKELNNPFINIGIYKISHLVDDNRIPLSFCDSIYRRGLTGALQLLSETERKGVSKLLEKHAMKKFPSKTIFKQWKKDFRRLLSALQSIDK